MAMGGSFTGVSQLEALLHLFSDPEAMAEKIRQLRELEDKAKAIVELAGPATEIVRIRAEVDQLLKDANEKLAAAQAESDRLVANGQSTAQGIVTEARAAATTTLEDAEKVRLTIMSLESGINRDRALIESQQIALATERREVDALIKTMRGERQTLANEKAALEARIANFRKAQELTRELVENPS